MPTEGKKRPAAVLVEDLHEQDQDEHDVSAINHTAASKKVATLPLWPSKNESSPLPHILDCLSSIGCEQDDDSESSSDDYHLDLSFPVPARQPLSQENQGEDCLSRLLQAMSCNSTSANVVTKCSVGTLFFQSISMEQRRAVVDSLGDLPKLQRLELDAVFAEFMYTYEFLRHWKRDHHYRHYRQYRAFENQTVEDISISQIPSGISEQVLGHLIMLTVNTFSSLKNLSISFVGPSEPNVALMRVALTALSHSKCLEDIQFNLEGHTILEVGASRKDGIMKLLKLGCCSGDNTLPLDCVALSRMLQVHGPALQGLVIDVPVVDDSGTLILADTLDRNKSNLKALCLGTFDCRDKTQRDGVLSLISRVLARPEDCQQDREPSSASCLEYLSLVCQEMDSVGVEQLSKVLAKSNLREVNLFLDNHVTDGIGTQGISSLAQALKVNKTMEDLSLICNILDDDGILEIAQVLKEDNQSLKNLKFQCNKSFLVSPRGYQALIDMLKVNTALESIELGRCSEEDPLQEQSEEHEMALAEKAVREEDEAVMDYYLKLNKGGVRNLQLNIDTTPSHFLTKVVSHREELNTLFYMLSANPSFVAFGAKEA